MQMGGETPAKASIELGRVQIPSPQIKPDATASPNASALALFAFCTGKKIFLARWKRWKKSLRRERAMQGGWKNEK
jgi:hypothetical protein